MSEKSNLEAAPLRYAGVATLLRRPLVTDPSGVEVALIGVPFDGATENRPGARHGPREVRNMSSFTRTVHHVTRVNPYELCNVADLGFVLPVRYRSAWAAITRSVSQFYGLSRQNDQWV
jgi:guanidinopropionase